MKVHWTNTAEGHLDAIYDYIAQDSPEYALRMVDRITRRSQQIAAFPLSGHTVPEYEIEQIREIIEIPYRIIYYIKPDQIDILAVIHGAQNIFMDDIKAYDEAKKEKSAPVPFHTAVKEIRKGKRNKL
ncbi:MAG TPA: type II toxin-antitoxin system RelE/ParE family toxin [Lentisphaeria bacterium]|nr:type II toxin-antitoxin system RelE/ParE family toxin [Lentisphaeria bacterium]